MQAQGAHRAHTSLNESAAEVNVPNESTNKNPKDARKNTEKQNPIIPINKRIRSRSELMARTVTSSEPTNCTGGGGKEE